MNISNNPLNHLLCEEGLCISGSREEKGAGYSFHCIFVSAPNRPDCAGAFIRYPILVLTPRVAQRATVLGRRMQLKLAQIL
jgi:hypothetical protein